MNEIEGIIKNLIHIDKNAVLLREKFKNEIENKKKQIEIEIEKLKNTMIDNELKKIEEFERNEIEKANKVAAELTNEAMKKCSEIEKKYELIKEQILESVLNELFLD